MNNLFAYSGTLIFLTCSILIFIIIKSGKRKLSQIWVFFNIAVAIWGFGAFFIGNSKDPSIAFLWWKIAHIGVIFIPVFMYHVVSIICELKQKRLLTLIYLQGLFFLFIDVINPNNLFLSGVRQLFSSLYYGTLGPLYHPFFVIWLSIVFYSHYKLSLSYFRLKGIKKTQITYFLLATFLGFLGGLTNFITAYGIDVFPYGNFTIPLYCIITTYAIVRYRLMDINFVLKKTAVYSLSAGILTSLFVVIVVSMTKLLSEMAGITSLTITVIAAITIAILFNPLKNRIQKIIDKTFYKKTYDYYATLHKVSHELASMFDIKRIYSFIGDIIFSILGLKNIYLLSVVSDGDYEVVYRMPYDEKGEKREVEIDSIREEDEERDRKRLRIAQDCLMAKFLRTSENIVIKDELPGIIDLLGQETIDCIKIHLELFDGEVLVPVFVDDKLSFLIILGEKLSGDMFTNEDIKLLETISDQTAIAIKNASLYAEKVKSERLASMGMMSATFAHEVRNPLTSIKTFAQLMPEKHNDPEFNSTFSKIVINEIERIDGLIKDLLHFSSGKVLTSMDVVDIAALIDEVLEYQKVKLDLERRKISVEKIYRSVKINIMGDSKKLKQTFINIISNGCQAMGENGVLKVNINSNGRNVDILISDTGGGISREDISRIFEPFYTTKSLGIGLGLAISKKIIEDHGGNIRVKSELSKGTTFIVSLPVNNN